MHSRDADNVLAAPLSLLSNTGFRLKLLYLGVSVFGAGYIVLLIAVLRGQVPGLSGIAVSIVGFGLLVAAIFGVLLARLMAEIRGEI